MWEGRGDSECAVVCVWMRALVCVCVCACVCVCVCVGACLGRPAYSVCRWIGASELCVHPPPCTPGASTYLCISVCICMCVLVHVHVLNYQVDV